MSERERVCVCESERVRERKREGERERKRKIGKKFSTGRINEMECALAGRNCNSFAFLNK